MTYVTLSLRESSLPVMWAAQDANLSYAIRQQVSMSFSSTLRWSCYWRVFKLFLGVAQHAVSYAFSAWGGRGGGGAGSAVSILCNHNIIINIINIWYILYNYYLLIKYILHKTVVITINNGTTQSAR